MMLLKLHFKYFLEKKKILKEYINKTSKKIIKIQTTIIIFLIYYLIITPISFIQKLFTKEIKDNTYWEKVKTEKKLFNDWYKQY